MTTDVQNTIQQPGSRLLFSTYDAGEDDYSWSVRFKRPGQAPVVLCRSNKDTARATRPIMEALFRDHRIEAILTDILRLHGEPLA